MATEGMELSPHKTQYTLVLHARAPMAQIGPTLQEHYGRLFAYATAIGAEPSTMPFARYFSMSPEWVDFEAGIILPAPMQGKGDIKASTLPAGEVCAAWHIGPFDSVAETYAKMEAFAREQGRKPGSGVWEVYWSDPKKEPDPKKWRTQVFMPLAA